MPSPCVEHKQKGTVFGYARTTLMLNGRRVTRLMHRVVFFREHGWWPEVVMHVCDNPRCINPEHLMAGTRALNNKDSAAKGRTAKNRPAKRKLTADEIEYVRHSSASHSELGRAFNVAPSTIMRIRNYTTCRG